MNKELKTNITEVTLNTQEELVREINIWTDALKDVTNLHKGTYIIKTEKSTEKINLSAKNNMLNIIEVLTFLINELK